jgi:hypothetical protein
MAPPPPGPTLGALLELLRRDRSGRYHLGDYSATALLVSEAGTFRLYALHGGVLGVSPEHDRMPDVGELLFEAHDVDDLVSKLLGVWTPRYGTLLAEEERIYARVTGVDRRRLLIDLRERWAGGLAIAAADQVIDAKRALEGDEARTVAAIAQALGAKVAWTGKRSWWRR